MPESDAPFEFVVAAGEEDRLDRVLQKHMGGGSRRDVARLISEGRVRVNGKIARKGHLLAAGACVQVAGGIPEPVIAYPDPQPDLLLELLFEDADLVAINKPAGMFSHPLRPGETGTLANGLVARFPDCRDAGDPREAGLVQRLDIGTSGVILAARHRDAYQALRGEFKGKRVRKEYLALVEGATGPGGCDAPVAGSEAFTEWTVERKLAGFTLLRCVSYTGRRHQVRVHLARCAGPIYGDREHGATTDSDTGAFLHAETVRIAHPRTKSELFIRAPLPAARAALLDQIGGHLT